ncbi:hypothetical protein QN360_13100 [Glaciimonas sp. CA11.2]|uniref:hypothetical protein n=1 Tax=unclassified Glaciimonas TaxID=2644401 RepID=UPI002AB423A8|nr:MULTISPECIES: hypothetical protein [unclassified Glaciimonas]MDY7547247.1 hypothetical protein [Glaciimonas sp. CA11.2]MEB0012594.1 hypothetical protein [Glaciimonas sp. Cout2]MEB0083945.1 hypothetical protein [Glaciimonas sp. Gout2]MEB0163840.1 hypothetical protein [Glaciimonas sp. CA11.2]
MFAKSTHALLIDKLDLRNWFMSRTHLLSDSHRIAVGEVLNEQLALYMARLGGMAGVW